MKLGSRNKSTKITLAGLNFRHGDKVTLVGVAANVVVKNDQGWGWIYLQQPGADNQIKVTGIVASLSAGCEVKAVGIWHIHPTYGEQLKAQSISVVSMPQTLGGLVAWMQHRLPHIGPVRARALWELFGADLWNVLEHDRDKLLVVDGITPERLLQIEQAYYEFRDEQEWYAKLAEYGLGEHLIRRMLRKYRHKAVEVFEKDPYQVWRDLDGVPFKAIDEAALRKGVHPLDTIRIAAGYEYALQQLENQGHTWGYRFEVIGEVQKLLGIGSRNTDLGYKDSVERKLVVESTEFEGEKWISRTRIVMAEQSIARQIVARLTAPPKPLAHDPADGIHLDEPDDLDEPEEPLDEELYGDEIYGD